MPKFAKVAIAAFVMSIALGAFATEARANSSVTTCIPWDLEFYSGNDATHPEQVMVVHCLNDQTSYRAYYGTNQETCSTLTIKQVSTWVGLIASAYIYGLPIVLYWSSNSCGQTTIDGVGM